MNSHPSLATRTVNVLLWTLQVLWGVLFCFSGFGKVLAYDPAVWRQFLHQVAWFSAVPQGLFIFIGICEGLGGLGLILPAMTRVAPKLTPIAAAGLTLIMILAAGFHIARSEYHWFLLVNLVLGGLAALIAWGRFAMPIKPKPINSLRTLAGLTVLCALVLGGVAPVLYQATHVH
jgi:uncharacterized membrane protein YphA (DoxX/SURF4 family)